LAAFVFYTVAITLDYSDFNKAIKNAMVYTSRDPVTVLNNEAKYVIIQTAQRIKKASADAIQKTLTADTDIVRTTTKTGRVLKKPKLVAHRPSIAAYKIINAQQRKKGLPGLNNAQMSIAVQAMIGRRKSAVGFAAYIGWMNALEQVGGRGFGGGGAGAAKRQARFAKSSAAQGGATLATESSLSVSFWNRVSYIERINGLSALQGALDYQAREMVRHLEEKLAKSFQSL
jgi:hypothetical protein